jgi:serine/threonine protein kinase
LKTSNILLKFEKNNFLIKICDFGNSTYNNASNYHQNGIGTLNFMAPEVYQGSIYDEKCDSYSLGIILNELLNILNDRKEENDNKM